MVVRGRESVGRIKGVRGGVENPTHQGRPPVLAIEVIVGYSSIILGRLSLIRMKSSR
jgi:hypothetical protein